VLAHFAGSNLCAGNKDRGRACDEKINVVVAAALLNKILDSGQFDQLPVHAKCFSDLGTAVCELLSGKRGDKLRPICTFKPFLHWASLAGIDADREC